MSPLERQVTAYLRRQVSPVSSRLLARQFLAMTVDSEQLATRLVAPMMKPAGARYHEGQGWSLPPPMGADGAGVAGGAPATLIAAAADPVTGEVALASPGGEAAPDLEGASVVMVAPAREAVLLRAWAARQGMAQPASIVSLRGVVRRMISSREPDRPLRIPRAAGLHELCGLLGVRWLDTDDAPGAARAIAACLAWLAATPAPAKAEPGRELPSGITPGLLAALPRGPGVYRFYDASGTLIYAGKARDLRRRVSSYFTAGASRRPRRFYGDIHRVEVKPTGTELEALIGEARLIASRLPAGNVQLQVHERPSASVPVRSCALLLPRADRRGLTVIVLRDGRCLGRASLGPRGGGLAAVKKWIGLALCPRARGMRGQSAPRAGARARTEEEILRSWLGRHGESICRLDLDGFGKTAPALTALRKAAAELLIVERDERDGGGGEGGPVVYRSAASTPKLRR